MVCTSMPSMSSLTISVRTTGSKDHGFATSSAVPELCGDMGVDGAKAVRVTLSQHTIDWVGRGSTCAPLAFAHLAGVSTRYMGPRLIESPYFCSPLMLWEVQ